MAVSKAVVAAEHGEQHRQGEVSVVHAALLAALAVNGVDRLPCLDGGHHFFLPRNDPEKHAGAHGGSQHGPHQQESRAPCEPMAGQPGCQTHQQKHQTTHNGITVFALPKDTTNQVVQNPKHHQERQSHGNGTGRRPIHARFVDQIGTGAPEVGHREQGKTRQPSAVAFPVKPVQMRGQLGRGDVELDRVIKPAAVHRPQLAAHALFFQVLIHRRGEAAVQKDKVEGGTNPGNGGDDMHPAQQQIGPIEVVAFHSYQPCRHPHGMPESVRLLTTAGAVSKQWVANTSLKDKPRSAATSNGSVYSFD